MPRIKLLVIGAAVAVPALLGVAACGQTTDGHSVKAAAPPAATSQAPTPQAPKVTPQESTYTDAQNTYLAVMHDATDLEGGPYTDNQLVKYGEQAVADGADTNMLSAALRLADETGIPPYDAGYITGAAAILLT